MFSFLILFTISVYPFASGNYLNYVTSRSTIHCCSKVNGANDPGDPLILTPYIERNQTDLAQKLSEVKGIGSHTSYSGYFNVDSLHNSNMFFWFFPAQNGDQSAPLLLWLQGGPGASSMFGLFVENGPLYIDSQGKVVEREVTWNKEYHLLFIDNPVRTGFSFTDSDEGLVTSEREVAENLYKTLYQFFQVFPSYAKNPFYITGESYAGKYLPALGYKIHSTNPTANLKINLVGIAMGDPLIDPEHTQGNYAELLYNLGLANDAEMMFIKDETNAAVRLIQQMEYIKANEIMDRIIGGVLYQYPVYIENITGVDLENYMRTHSSQGPPSYYTQFINQPDTRKAIHVGSTPYEDGSYDVGRALVNDIMASQSKNLSILLNSGYKVLLYSGELDIVIGAALTEHSLRYMQWNGQDEYLRSKRDIWRIDPTDRDVAGYVTTVGRFQRVVVRGGGHLVPLDQPVRASSMIKNFINLP